MEGGYDGLPFLLGGRGFLYNDGVGRFGGSGAASKKECEEEKAGGFHGATLRENRVNAMGK